MPVYKKPLFISASQYIDGSYSAELTPSELTSFGKDLLSGLENGIARNRSSALLVAGQLSELEAAGLISNDKNFEKWLPSMSTFLRISRSTNRLFRARDKIKRMLETDLSIWLEVLGLSPDGPGEPPRLTDGFIRSSQKLKIFYSKVFKEKMDLTDRQWKLIASFFPSPTMEPFGRPPRSCRDVLNGVFWKLRTGASWDDLPPEYPSHQTCYRYFTRWIKDDTLDRILRLLQTDLKSHGLDLARAVQRSEIEFIPVARQIVIRFAPRLQDTWQGSTALLILQVLLGKLKKGGRIPKKTTPVFTSIMDTMKIMNRELEQK